MSKIIFISTLAFAAFMFWTAQDAMRLAVVAIGHHQQRMISADDTLTLNVR